MPLKAKAFLLPDPESGTFLGRFGALDAVPGLVHGVGTRQGPDFSASPESGDARKAVDALCKTLRMPDGAWLKQVHGRHVVTAEQPGCLGEGDALISTARGLALIGRSADCPLVLVAGPAAKSEIPDADRDPAAGTEIRGAGMAHASWRGSVKRVTVAMVAALIEHAGIDARRLVAAICPSAGPCCYEVGADVESAFTASIGADAAKFFERRDGRLYLDLWRANIDQLQAAGIRSANIHCAGICTICNEELFPSYRRDGARAGRFAAAIGWR